MEIHDLKLKNLEPGAQELSAVVGGRSVFFSVSGAPLPLQHSYDPFVLAGFGLAMESGTDVRVADDAPVSKALLANLDHAATIYRQWWDGLKAVRVQASVPSQKERGKSGPTLVGSFFSGGLDSIYSFMKNRNEITHLILCRGLDIAAFEEKRWKNLVGLVRAFAKDHGVEVILVDTNVKDQLQKPVNADNHGAVLVSTALALRLDRLIVPASHSLRDMIPWGSHPMLDPLFSNGTTQVLHDSPIRRSAKIEGLVAADFGMECLRVCNVLTEEVNCGACEKCLRTRAALHMAGGRSPHLAPMPDPRELRGVRIAGDTHRGVWKDNLALARRTESGDFEDEILRLLKRYQLRSALKDLDQALLGGRLLKLWRSSSNHDR